MFQLIFQRRFFESLFLKFLSDRYISKMKTYFKKLDLKCIIGIIAIIKVLIQNWNTQRNKIWNWRISNSEIVSVEMKISKPYTICKITPTISVTSIWKMLVLCLAEVNYVRSFTYIPISNASDSHSIWIWSFPVFSKG